MIDGLDETARALGGLQARAAKAVEQAVAEEARAIAAETPGARVVMHGPFDAGIQVPRSVEFGSLRRPARPLLIRLMLTRKKSFRQRVSQALLRLLESTS